jgi:hypothetical protein
MNYPYLRGNKLEENDIRDFQIKKYPKISCGAGIKSLLIILGGTRCPSHKIG